METALSARFKWMALSTNAQLRKFKCSPQIRYEISWSAVSPDGRAMRTALGEGI